MNIIYSLLAFWVGVGISNMAQWGKWVQLHPVDSRGGYWKQGGGWGHMMGNLLFDAILCAAWASQFLDWLQAHGLSSLPGGYPVPGYIKDIPVNPALGIIIGGLGDFSGDFVSFYIRNLIPWGSKNRPAQEKTA